MGQQAGRLVYPLTFVFKQEDDQWSALACEVDVASCGDTLDEAREGLKDAVELYLSYMLENGFRDKVARPVPQQDLVEFCAGERIVEYYAAIAELVPISPLRLELIRSELEPADCRYVPAGGG